MKLKLQIVYQCPFGLVLHFYCFEMVCLMQDVNVVSMPFRAETPFLPEAAKVWKNYKALVSMPFRADAPFLRKNACRRIQKRLLCINALSG